MSPSELLPFLLLKRHSGVGAWLDRLAGAAFLLLGLRLLFAQFQRKA